MIMRSLHCALLTTVAVVGFASIASGADMPMKAAPESMPTAHNWTGCYIGAEAGGNWGRSQDYYNDPAGPALVGLAQTSGIHLSGGLIGGTVGCNYQFGSNWVIGAEGDMSWTNNSGTAPTTPPFTAGETFGTSESWFSTIRGRFGFAWDRAFIYGTGGAAFAKENISLCDSVAGCVSASSYIDGWAAGGGIEYAFLPNWSGKIEYLHADFGTQSYGRLTTPAVFANGSTFFAARRVTLTDDIVRIGINYKFDWGSPGVTTY
jgi:outer membrane immunogenic protein